MFSIGILGFIVWSLEAPLEYYFEVINSIICGEGSFGMSTWTSHLSNNLNSLVQSASFVICNASETVNAGFDFSTFYSLALSRSLCESEIHNMMLRSKRAWLQLD
jgi:hypothetical protein